MSVFHRTRRGDAQPRLGRAQVFLRRSRLPRFAVVVVVALGAGNSLAQARAGADQARADWASREEVWVATRDLFAGTALGADDIELLELPRIALPRDAVTSDPGGSTLASSMVRGEVLRVGRIESHVLSPTAARLPAQTAGLTITVSQSALAVGDRVDVYGLLDGNLLASGAEVIAVNDNQPTLAIAETELPAVIRALTIGGVVPVLVR